MNIHDAIVATKYLVDFQRDNPTRKPSNVDKFMKNTKPKEDRPTSKPQNFKGKVIKIEPEERSNVIYVMSMIQNYLKKKSFNLMVSKEENVGLGV